MITATRTRTHTYIAFANPFLVCETCDKPVARFHDHKRCSCGDSDMDGPECGHLDVRSVCPSWGPVDGCSCVATYGYLAHT